MTSACSHLTGDTLSLTVLPRARYSQEPVPRRPWLFRGGKRTSWPIRIVGDFGRLWLAPPQYRRQLLSAHILFRGRDAKRLCRLREPYNVPMVWDDMKGMVVLYNGSSGQFY